MMSLLASSSKGSQYGFSTWLGNLKAAMDDSGSYDTRVVEPPSNTSELELESEICKEWKMGRCTKGEKCRFRHKNARARYKPRHNPYGVWLLNSALNLQEAQEAGDDTNKEVRGLVNSVSQDPTSNEGGKQKSYQIKPRRPFPIVEDVEALKEESENDVHVKTPETLNFKMFEELGKKRREELPTEDDEESDGISRKGEGEPVSEDDSAEIQQDWVAGRLEELGRRRREQHQSMKQRLGQQREMDDGDIRAEVDQYPESSATTEQFIVLESNLVIYAAGLQVHQITPGYDLCQISLQLPIGTTRTAIMAMVQEQGLGRSDFHILKIVEIGGSIEAIIITSIRFGQLLERRKSIFKDRKVTLHLRRDAVWTSETMKGIQPYLSLAWDASTPQSSRISSDAASIALATVYDSLFDSQGAQMETCCVITPETGSTDNQVMMMVEFDNWDNALKAARTIQANRPKGIPSLVATTPDAYHWSIAIPLLQYEAQNKQWLGLSDTQNEARIETKINDDVVIHVHGNNMASAGALKVRVEKLARGEILEGVYWHPSFASTEESEKFLKKIAQTAQVHLVCHPDSRTLVAYGEFERVGEACKLIKAEVTRREQVTTKTTLSDASDDFFARGGFEKVKELVGEENVDWKITSMWSVIRMKGGEEATHHLQRLIKESLVKRPTRKQGETTCPVCFTETPYPEMLGCGHGYCPQCLNLFLKAAADNKSFPIVCVGEGATCNIPIALPFIRRFLPHHTFKCLTEAAFAAYLERNPTQFRYCKTPDCRQTYRQQSVKAATTITCPSCFAKTCSSCSEDHENMTCEEHRIYRDPEEQERLNDVLASTNGYKRCPRCAVWVEKTGGCNHVSCKCGVHICWICLGIFDVGAIYKHISDTH